VLEYKFLILSIIIKPATMREQIIVTTMILSVIIRIIQCQQPKKNNIASPVLLSKYARPLTHVTFASSPDRLQRGIS
jgi:hypothetical protein